MSSTEQPQPVQALHGTTPKAYSGRVSVTPAQPDRLIRIHEVCTLTSVGKTSVYSIEGFPKRVQLSRRAVGWRLSEVQAWIESRIQAIGKSYTITRDHA